MPPTKGGKGSNRLNKVQGCQEKKRRAPGRTANNYSKKTYKGTTDLVRGAVQTAHGWLWKEADECAEREISQRVLWRKLSDDLPRSTTMQTYDSLAPSAAVAVDSPTG